MRKREKFGKFVLLDEIDQSGLGTEYRAAKLGNTPAICRKCYVHPEVIGCYLDGTLVDLLREKVAGKLRNDLEGLDAAEAAVLAFLQKRLERNPPLAA